MDTTFLANKSTKSALQELLESPPSAIGLIGDRGAGKGHIAEYIAACSLGIANVVSYPYYYYLDCTTAGIENIRELQHSLTLQVPGRDSIRRVVILEHFQNLGHEAQNAMLKTLEEPPLDTMLILTIDNEKEVLGTILSRIQPLRILPISFQDTIKHFNTMDRSTIERIFAISDGQVGLLHELMENNESHELVMAINEAKRVLKLPKYQRLAQIDSIIKSDEISVHMFLQGLIRVMSAVHEQVTYKETSKKKALSYTDKLTSVLNTLSDINNGVSVKLALTRLFLTV